MFLAIKLENFYSYILGRLKYFVTNWKKFTCDPFILQTIQGLKIQFNQKPFQLKPRITPSFGIERAQIIQKEIDNLLEKGAIIPAVPVKGQFVSSIFLVDKKTGRKRPVINLKYFNQFVTKRHFKMSGLRSVLNQIKPGDFLYTMDLTDAYFSVPIHKNYRKYFRFLWKKQIFEFLVMVFGLTTAPWVFTKITKPLIAFLHSRGARASIYIDDGIGMAQSLTLALQQKDMMVNVFQEVGFVVNFAKSSLVPEHRKVYLGFVIDTVLMKVFLTVSKVEVLIQEIQTLLFAHQVSVRHLARVIGLIVSAFPAFYQGPLHYRNLEWLKIQTLKIHQSYQTLVTLSPVVCQELQWWIDNIQVQNGKDINPPPVDIVIKSDASLQGWGAILDTHQILGVWSQQEQDQLFHINILEMLAVQKALWILAQDMQGIHIQLQVDSSTVVK